MSVLMQAISLASTVLSFLIIGRALMSWVNPNPGNQIARFIHGVTEPLLAPVRSLLPSAGGMDFSPMVVLIAIQILESMLLRALAGLAM